MKETVMYRGFEIEIIQDEHAESPQVYDNDDCFLVYDHNNFTVRKDSFDPAYIFHQMKEKPNSLWCGYHVFPVYAYIHSGIVLSLGSSFSGCDPGGWDTSMKGFALVKRIKGWSWRNSRAKKIAQAVVEEWNQYLSGEVYGYNTPELGDSCWNYYGNPKESGLLDDAESAIDYHIKSLIEKRVIYLKRLILSKVPIIYRTPFKIVS